jgi:hypothetical protein
MSDIVERLQAANEWMRAPDWNDDLDLVSWLHRRPAGGFQGAIDEIIRLTAEVEQNAIDLEEYRRDVERLRAALVRWLDAINDKRAFEHHHPDDLGKEWSRLREAVDLAEDNARAALSGDKP